MNENEYTNCGTRRMISNYRLTAGKDVCEPRGYKVGEWYEVWIRKIRKEDGKL